MARAVPAGLQRHRRRRHPRPLLPRQRGRVDPRARPRPRHPLRGQLLGVARARSRSGWRRRNVATGSWQDTLARELEWIRMSPKARQSKGKARLTSYEQLLAEASDGKDRAEKLEIFIPPGPRLGDVVIESEAVTKGFGDRLLIDDLTFVLPPGGIVGVIGPERRRQDHAVPHDHRAGAARRAANSPSARRSRSPTSTRAGSRSTASDGLRGDHRGHRRPGRRRPGDPRPGLRRVVRLQGHRPAEEGRRAVRRRAQPAPPGQDALSGGNVLLLDEPTNDLDVDTLRALEDALLAFPGCAVVISHDRWFLDRIATHVLAFEGDSEVRWYRGQLHRLRGRPQEAPRRRRRPAAPRQVQAARAELGRASGSCHRGPSVGSFSPCAWPGSAG